MPASKVQRTTNVFISQLSNYSMIVLRNTAMSTLTDKNTENAASNVTRLSQSAIVVASSAEHAAAT